MPKLWDSSVDAHRHAVHEATLDAAERLFNAKGLTGVTMVELARETGIGRATLYKYFKDLGDVLAAWHARHIETHVHNLDRSILGGGPPLDRIRMLLSHYARMRNKQQSSGLAAALHHEPHAVAARRHLIAMMTKLISEAAKVGAARGDIKAAELTVFSLAACEGAADLRGPAVERLIDVILSALRPR